MYRKSGIEKIKSICYLTLGGSVVCQLLYMKKQFNEFYSNYVHPLNTFIDPEKAHEIGIFALKHCVYPSQKEVDKNILETKFLNFNLSNPIGIAAGFDKHGDAILGLRRIGFSIIEIGSITPLPQPGNPKPRVFRLPEDNAVINRYGFNSEGHDVVYNKIKNIDKSILGKGILGINLGKNKESPDAIADYIMGIHKFADIADYFVINISSPNTPGLRSLQDKNELRKLLVNVNKCRFSLQNSPPLFLKLAPDLSNEEKSDIAAVIMKADSRVDGLIISNTTVNRDALMNKQFNSEQGGLSGKPLSAPSTEMIKQMYKLTKGSIPIIGVGGVFSGQDAYDKILAGASALQIYTALIFYGPPIISKIKEELQILLEENGYKNVTDAVGKGAI